MSVVTPPTPHLEPGVPPTAHPRAPRSGASGGVVALAVLLGLGLLLVVVLVALGERVMFRGEALPAVHVAGVKVAGQDEAELARTVEEIAARVARQPVVVDAGGTRLTADPSALGISVDVPATVRAARRAGRAGGPVAQVSGTVLRGMRDEDLPLVLSVDDARLEGALDGWTTQTGKGLVDGDLRFEGATVVEVHPKSGTGIDRATTRAAVLDAVAHRRTGVIEVPIGRTRPVVDSADVRRAAAQARAILAAPALIRVGATDLTVPPEQLATTLGTTRRGSRLVVTVNPDRLRSVLAPALAPMETAAKDATWAVSGTSVSVVPAVVGTQVDLTSAAMGIERGQHLVVAGMREVQPARTTAAAQALNITELVSSYTTNHPCCQPRVTNIHKGADTINNTIVEPGATFSLNGALGPRTLEKGYVAAPAIGADLQYEDSVGGGVSQLSTTLFNAVFFGGYQDVTHTVHALYISRYPMGREATLNYPSIDNKFRNDTKCGVLIRTAYSNTAITVSLYGCKDGRSVRAEGPNVLQTIPPDVKYVDDPTLPAGAQKVLSEGHTGYVVENFRIITYADGTEKRQRFLERYSMSPTTVARGTAAPPTTTTVAPVAPPAPASPPAAPPAG